MIIRTALTILIALLLCIRGNAQTQYQGRVMSGLTGKPVHSADIEIAGNIIATTDSLGYFKVQLDSPIIFSVLFFSSVTRWVAMDTLLFKSDGTTIITLFPECIYSATRDILENKIKLFYPSGPFSPLLTKSDLKFERKYGITYFGDGSCTDQMPQDCIETYNLTIARHLDKKYGTGWRKEVRANAYAF